MIFMSNASTKNFAVFVARVDFPIPILRQGVLLNSYWRQFETEIIERYRRRQSSVEEALVEMYLAAGPQGPLATRDPSQERYLWSSLPISIPLPKAPLHDAGKGKHEGE
jgi:hypothetical protein